MSEGEYHAREFVKRLKEESTNKDDPFPEWTRPKLIDRLQGDKCICKKDIHIVYEITNKITGKNLSIGCDCAERWFKAQFKCEECNSVLGNIKKRLQEKNFICPQCSRKNSKREKFLSQKWLHRSVKIGKYIGIVRELLESQEFCNDVLNVIKVKSNQELALQELKELIGYYWVFKIEN